MVEILRIEIGAGQVVHDLAVGGQVPLMPLHHPAENVPVLRQGKAFHRLQAGEGLEAELADKAEMPVPVIREGFVPVPHVPVVHVSPASVHRIVEGAAGRGRAGPVEGLGRQLPDQLRQDVFKHFDVVRVVVGRGALPGGMPRPVLLPHGEEMEFLHLVVAAEERQGGMMPQPADVVLRLRDDAGLKGIRQVIVGAGKHEILPDQKPQLVAGIVEIVGRIVSAAPDPHRVEIRQPGVLQQPAGPFRRQPAEEVILRNIVRAHGEDLPPVHRETEFLAIRLLFPGNFDGPQADALFPDPGGFPVHDQLNPHRIQGLGLPALAVLPRRPPELRVLDHHGTRRVRRPGFSLRPRHRGPGFDGPQAPLQLDFRSDFQRHPPRLVLLPHHGAGNPSAPDHLQLDIPPDAGVGQPGTPVPAELAVHLPQVRKARRRVRRLPAGALFMLRRHIFHRGFEQNPDLVLSLPQQGLHLPFPGAVHIVRPADRLPVHIHPGQGVQPFAVQQQAVRLQILPGNREGAHILIVLLHQGKGGLLVLPPEGILHAAVPQQIRINRPGHQGLVPCRLVRRPHPPGAVQGNLLHPDSFLLASAAF